MHIRTLLLAATLLASGAAQAALPIVFSTGPTPTVVGGFNDAIIQLTVGIQNTGPTGLTLGLQRQVLSEVGGTQNNFCFGVGCYPPNISVAPTPIQIAAGGTDNTFLADYEPMGYAGITRIRYAVYDVNGAGTSADTAYFTATFDARTAMASPAELAASPLLGQLSPNPVANGELVSVDFTPNKAAEGQPAPQTVQLRDLRDGRVVRTMSIGMVQPTSVGHCGTVAPGITAGGCYFPADITATSVITLRIPTAGLSAGVYACTLTSAAGRPLAMRRLVVQ